jgi:GNAT superfamily N-acetyltransferase
LYALFTSVNRHCRRNVAKIASAALAKGIKSGKIPVRFVAVTCHYDILDWLEPDWVLDTATGEVSRRLLRRPEIELEIHKCHPNDWRLFSKHHYLNSKQLSTGSQCYVALYNKIPVAFCSVMPSCGHTGVRRISRIVTLPDYQGVGIGKALFTFVADRYKHEGYRMTIGTSHPAMVQSLLKDKRWVFRQTQETGTNVGSDKRTKNLRKTVVIGRKVAYFEYVEKSN